MLSSFIARLTEINNIAHLDGTEIGDMRLWRACLQLFDEVEQSDVDWTTLEGESVVKKQAVHGIAQQDWITDFTSTLQTYEDLPQDGQVERNTEFGTKLQEMLDIGVDRLGIQREAWTSRLQALNLM